MPVTLSESKKELLEKLLRGGGLAAVSRPGIQRRAEGVEVPISYGQQQVWLHSQYSTEIPIYNEPVTVHYFGPMDRNALQRAFTEIICRHEAWRTTFAWNGPRLVQRIGTPPEHIEFPFLDVSGLPAETREEAALKVATEDALAPFDLAVGPMYRPRLVRFSEEEHRLYLGLHHIIFDGVSLYQVFLPELQALYQAFSQGKPSPLAPLALQYGDYAIWHRQWVEEISAKQLAYWREKLAGVGWRDILHTDHPRTTRQSFRGAMETLKLDAEVSSGVKELSQRAGVTLFMTLLAFFHAVIWAYTREDDLVTGGTSAGRSRSETESLMGFFLNTIVLRIDLSGDPTFLELIQRGKEELLSSLANDGVPFETVVKELAPQRGGGRNPFFEVSFSFEPPLAPLQPGWKFTQMDIETGAAKFDLHLELDERHDGIIGRFIYNVDLFERETIEEMLGTWREIVHRAVDDPTRRLSQLVPPLEALRKASPAAAPAARPELPGAPSSVATAMSPAGGKPKGLIGSLRRRLWSK